MTEPDEKTLSKVALDHYQAHENEAKERGMSGHQYAMKHKESDGVKGHRARMRLAIHSLKKNDEMSGEQQDKDAFNEAMEKY